MIDSNRTETLGAAIEQFREYIIHNYGSDSGTAKDYLQTADRLEHYAVANPLPHTEILEGFYAQEVGQPAFKPPVKKSKERHARTVLIIRDLIHGVEPKRRYVSHSITCPQSFQAPFERYQVMMQEDQKSQGTIQTRAGRIKIFFTFLSEEDCAELKDITPELFVSFISELNAKYSSQGQASILYTIRNFFSYTEFSEQLSFDLRPFVTGLHSKKHERLVSFYTASEIRLVLEAVDRNTSWGKTAYLMMLLACVYGLRSSDIKSLRLDDIRWAQRTITIIQYKTKKKIELPLTDEVLYALLDYIKNARPKSEYRNVFIRLYRPYVPYSTNDHLGDKIEPYFKKAGIKTDGKHHGFHSMRHSLATNLLSDGVPVNDIATILGHSSAASTKSYVWSDIEHLRIAALEVPCHD